MYNSRIKTEISKTNKEKIKEFLEVLNLKTYEVRIPQIYNSNQEWSYTLSGVFENPVKAAEAIEALGECDHLHYSGVYVGINQNNLPVTNALSKGSTVKDRDIVSRNWLPIDVDPVRPAGTSATPEQKQDTFGEVLRLREVLTNAGITTMLVDSGNGFVVYIKTNWDINEYNQQLIARFYDWLGTLVDNTICMVDTTVGNPARILKIPGTMACKGDIPMLWRMAAIIRHERLEQTTPEQIKQLVGDFVYVAKSKNTTAQTPEQIETAVDWFKNQLVEKLGYYLGEAQDDDYTKLYVECPWSAEHTSKDGPKDAMVQVFAAGGHNFKCSHSHCNNRGWSEFAAKTGVVAPPTADKQLEAAVDEVIGSGQTVNTNQTVSPVEAAQSFDYKAATDAAIKPKKVKFRNWSTIRQKGLAETVDWFVPGWLEFGSLGMLTGLPFAGKSCLVSELFASSATGKKFAGMDIQRCKMLYLNLENKDRIVAKRCLAAVEGLNSKGDLALENLLYDLDISDGVEKFPIPPDRFEEIINQFVAETGSTKTFVVIDTQRSCFGGDEFDPESMSKLLYPLQRIAQRHKLAILILHHNSRGKDSYHGTGSIAGALDYQWNYKIYDKDPELRELVLDGTRDAKQPPLLFSWDNENGRVVFLGKEKEAKIELGDKRQGEIKDRIIEMLTKHASDSFSQNRIVEWLKSAGEGAGWNVIKTCLTQLEAAKLVKHTGIGWQIVPR